MIALSSSNDDEEVGMKRYLVTLEKEEREELAGITRKGSHQSQKVINALILLNCDEGEFNEHRARGEAIAEILRISARKVDRVKKAFRRRGHGGGTRRAAGSPSPLPAQGRRRVRGALGGAELRRASAGPLAVVAAATGGSRRGARPHRQRVARDGAAGSKKTNSNRGGGSAG